jgi:serine/threonine protein kinase
MPKYQILSTGDTVDLNQNNFKAKGGEGSIHIIGNTVYKVCEAGKMIPDAKFKELAVLDHPHIIKPDDIILQKGKPIGYTMRLVPGDAKPLAQILTKSYREREGVTPDHAMKLVQQIADGLRFIHQHDGYLQVDGNEFNYMVTSKHDEVYFIDVNSFQTPHFPADAIMLSIRDWSVPKDNATGFYVWSKLSDWYSFAIISFYMFTAIHPFKGRHPAFKDMKTLMVDQMKAGKSVLDPESQYPLGAVYHPFEAVIPGGKDGAYMQWYRAVFCDNKRLPAPKDFQAMLGFIATKVKEIIGSNNFDIREVRDFQDMIIGYAERSGNEVVTTRNNIYLNGSKLSRPAERFRIGFTPKNNTPYACWIENDSVQLQNLQNGQMIQSFINGKDMMSCEGRVYIQSDQNIFELDFIEGSKMIATAKSIAAIMPNATTMYQGVVIQDMLGTMMFSVFPEAGHHRQTKIPEISDYRITDAKYEQNVLMVIGVEKKTGKYTRFVIRFSKDWSGYDVRAIEDITPTGLNFTVKGVGEKGVCVCLTEENKIEIFSNQKDNPLAKLFDDPAIDGEMKLCHAGDQVKFARGNKLYNFSVKK